MKTKPETIINIEGLEFIKFIDKKEILIKVNNLGKKIFKDLGNDVQFLIILKGSFIFGAHLVTAYKGACRISFANVQSYVGRNANGIMNASIISINISKEKPLIIVEDIIDKGNTMKYILDTLKGQNIKNISIASLLFKPKAFKYNFPIDYIGFEIPNDFVIGYGLDYNGYGRNLDQIYKLYEND